MSIRLYLINAYIVSYIVNILHVFVHSYIDHSYIVKIYKEPFKIVEQ